MSYTVIIWICKFWVSLLKIQCNLKKVTDCNSFKTNNWAKVAFFSLQYNNIFYMINPSFNFVMSCLKTSPSKYFSTYFFCDVAISAGKDFLIVIVPNELNCDNWKWIKLNNGQKPKLIFRLQLLPRMSMALEKPNTTVVKVFWSWKCCWYIDV